MRQQLTILSVLLLPLLCAPAYSNEFGGNVSVGTLYSNNTLKASSDEISERQDELGLGINGEYTNSLISFTTDYRAREYRFAKESQPDRGTLEGDTRLLIGQDHHPADLLLSHSRRSLKTNTDGIDLLQNRDERQILSAVPRLRYRASEVDSLLLRGDLSKIDYRYAELRNSERKGASLIWLHRFSSVDNFSVSVQQLDINYDHQPTSDYQYQQALASYSAELSRLTYNLELGYNASKPEVGEDLSAPSYHLEAAYTAGANIFTVSVDQRITDTSMGNGNDGDIFDTGNLNDVGNVGFDQIDRRAFTLGYNNSNFCDRCSIGINLRLREDDYQVLNEDNRDQGADLYFAYRLSQDASVGLNLTYQVQKYEAGVAREDYDQTRARLYYRLTFARDFSLEINVSSEDRNSDNPLQTYEEIQTGLTLGYNF